MNKKSSIYSLELNEIDLHDLTYDIAEKKFIELYNKFYRRGDRCEIRVIHGYGSSSLASTSVIKNRLRSFLKKNNNHLIFRLDLNPGVTYVRPLTLLPLKK